MIFRPIVIIVILGVNWPKPYTIVHTLRTDSVIHALERRSTVGEMLVLTGGYDKTIDHTVLSFSPRTTMAILNAQDKASFPTLKCRILFISTDPTVWITKCTINPHIYHIQKPQLILYFKNVLKIAKY